MSGFCQDAVVPHNLVVFSISFRSFSGLPATMKGHVCRGGETQAVRTKSFCINSSDKSKSSRNSEQLKATG